MNWKPQNPTAKPYVPLPQHSYPETDRTVLHLNLGNQSLQNQGRRVPMCEQLGNPQQLCTAFEANELELGGLGNPD